MHRLPGVVMAALSLLAAVPLLALSGEAAGVYALISSTVLAYAAAITGALAATRARGRARWGWILLGTGSLGWALGNTYWSWNELVAHAEVLFPSLADYGFLTFPLAGTAGLWMLSGRVSLGWRLTSVLDGLIFSGSLLAISWVVTLKAVYQSGADSTLAFIVSLAYPCGDLILGTMVFLLVTRARRGGREVIGLLILGLLGMTLSDTLFAVATAHEQYSSGELSDSGWIFGFAALAFAAGHAGRRPLNLDDEGTPKRWQLMSPYLPFGGAVITTSIQAASGTRVDVVQSVIVLTVFVLVMTRQMITIIHNSWLTSQLRHQAFHDSLTGLANRALFSDRLEHALAVRARGEGQLTVLYLDLDDFKLVNDTLGHDAGDALLRGVAERLIACCKPCDTIARLGGDEFAVIVEDTLRPAQEAEKILKSLERPFPIGADSVRARVSIGVASTLTAGAGLGAAASTRPGAGRITEVLLKEVDLALYAAKAQGKSNYAIFTPEMWHVFDEEISLRTELARALEVGGLSVVYQPIHELSTGRIVAVEALARWSDGTLGDVPPATFIPVAERAQLIAPIGQFVLERSCADFSQWDGSGGAYLSVNVSPLQLLDPTFSSTALATITQHGLSSHQVVLEVTETALADENEIAPVLARLREHGFRIAIDDFGSGYSSLRYLHHFPADVIKIDRSYVRDIEHDAEAANLLGALLQMISGLGRTCIAEGVETRAQAQQLADLGCRLCQGFLFSRPGDLQTLQQQAPIPTRQPAIGVAPSDTRG